MSAQGARAASDKCYLRRKILAISLLAALSQAAGFGKTWIVARVFGVGADLDGYYLALTVPGLIIGMVSGAIQVGFVPVCAHLRRDHGDEYTSRVERMVVLLTSVLAIAIAALLLIWRLPIADLIARDASIKVQAATRFVLYFVPVSVVLSIVGDMLSYQLAMRGAFLAVTAAPIANAAVSGILLLSFPEWGLSNLAFGTVIGLLIQVLIVAAAAKASGVSVFGALPTRIEFSAPARQMLTLIAWMIPALFFANLTNALPSLLAIPFGDGAVSAFGYAFRLHQSAVQLLVMAAGPYILARFSDLVATQQWAKLGQLQRQAFWGALAVGAFALLAVWVLGLAVLSLLFGRTRFDSDALARVQDHWVLLTLGLTPALYGNILVKRIQAEGRARTLALLSLLGTLGLIAAAVLLGPDLGERSVSLGLAISVTVVCIASHLVVRRYRNHAPR